MLGNYFYNETVRNTVIAFGTLFNNIFVKHTENDTDKTLSQIKVPIAYGPIQKFLARIEQQPDFDRNVAITLPRLSFEIVSYKYDASRKLSPITKFCTTPNSSKNKIKKLFMPVPYDIGFRLSFATKLQDDALQILEQILPYFQPSYNVSMKMLEGHDEVKDIPFTLNNIQFRDEYEGNFTERRFIVYELDFTVKQYFYNEVPLDESGGIIKKVQVDYATSPRAPREQRYTVTPKATKDYNDDTTTTLTETFPTNKTLLKVTSTTAFSKFDYIQVNQEVMRIREIDGNTLLVDRGQYDTTIAQHDAATKVSHINISDNVLVEVGDDFGFEETRYFFQDNKSFSPSQGGDV